MHPVPLAGVLRIDNAHLGMRMADIVAILGEDQRRRVAIAGGAAGAADAPAVGAVAVAGGLAADGDPAGLGWVTSSRACRRVGD